MDTRFLQTFLLVTESGSVAEAARRSNLTPAGVLQRLRALEAEFGTALITRVGRNLVPTPAGMAITARARALLGDVAELAALATAGVLAGELRLGAVPTAVTGLLPDILSAMRDAHPTIEITIVPGHTATLYAAVERGELDAAILAHPRFALPKSCGWHTLRREPLIVLAPAAMRGADPHAVLRAQPLIRYDARSPGGRLAEDYLRHHHLHPRTRYELVTLDAIAVLVDRGFGVSLVPDWAPPWPEGLRLTKLPLPGEAPVREMGLFWNQASARRHLVEALLARIRPVSSPGRMKKPAAPSRSRRAAG